MVAMEPSTSYSQEDVTWVRGRPLGSGSFGRVHMAVDSLDGAIFAVKSVDASRDSAHSRTNLRALENEICVLSTLDSPYIVQYLGDSWSTEERPNGAAVQTRNLHMELAPGGSLAGLVKSTESRGLGAELVKRYTKDIVSALAYLHSRHIVHGDLKCLNVLVTASSAKLADFGTACMGVPSTPTPSGPVSKSKSLKGSPLWMSPESVRDEGGLSTAVDIWSLGCSVLEMATGKAPWSEVDAGVHGVLYALGCTDSTPRVPDCLPCDLRDFILSCLRRNPEERPTAEALLQHPFLCSSPECREGDSTRQSGGSSAQSSETVSTHCHLASEGAPETGERGKRSRLHPSRLSVSSTLSFETQHPNDFSVAHSSVSMGTEEGDFPILKKQRIDDGGCSGFFGTQTFPILFLAATPRKDWSESDVPSCVHSPLSQAGKDWIVVRSP